MIESILNELNIKNRECRFVNPPRSSYAVWFDSFRSRGADKLNLIKEHDITVELYEYQPDRETEKLIEDYLDKLGIEYEKQDRYWIENEQIYQVIYEFSHIEKEGGK